MQMRSSQKFAALTAAAMLALSAARSIAAPVAAGETTTTSPGEFVTPTGDVVSTDDRPITLTFTAPTGFSFGAGETGVFDATFTSQMLRDPATQQLTFQYAVDAARGDLAGESGTFSIGNFGDFTTDVTANATWTVTRSADGNTLNGVSPGQGVGPLPQATVATNATNFNSNGTFNADFGVELTLLDG